MSHGMHRLVTDPKGVTLHEGLHLPPGTRIGAPVWAIHDDNSVYEDASVFDAFRFSRAREDVLAGIPVDEEDGSVDSFEGGGRDKEEHLAKVLESKNLATVTTSETFL